MVDLTVSIDQGNSTTNTNLHRYNDFNIAAHLDRLLGIFRKWQQRIFSDIFTFAFFFCLSFPLSRVGNYFSRCLHSSYCLIYKTPTGRSACFPRGKYFIDLMYLCFGLEFLRNTQMGFLFSVLVSWRLFSFPPILVMISLPYMFI